MEKKKVEMTSQDGEREETNGEEEGRDDPPGLERWNSLMEKGKEEEGGDDLMDGEMEEYNGEG